MRKWKLFSLIMFVMLGMITNDLKAQGVPISGTVLSDDGTPLAGVTVAISGTKRAVVTNELATSLRQPSWPPALQ